jgi:hypothetical protein
MISGNIKVNFMRALKTVMASLHGMTDHIIKVSMKMMRSKEEENYLIDIIKL